MLRKVLLLPFLRALTTASTLAAAHGEELAIVNLIRHGEKCPNSGKDLTADGQARAEYLARCIHNAEVTSEAFPFGAPSVIMAGERNSYRPLETVQPLAAALGLQVAMPCHKSDYKCFAKYVQESLSSGSTLLASWTHEDMAGLVEALDVPNVPHGFSKWPEACPSPTWPEPTCPGKIPKDPQYDSNCYDLLWQVTMQRRTGEDETWKAVSIQSFQEGFGGAATSPCLEGLAPTRARAGLSAVPHPPRTSSRGFAFSSLVRSSAESSVSKRQNFLQFPWEELI
mmetsp:Transcript_60080/g.143143  ORF Transcript_60080/g.143143 Transcript_60080/m.143143 type:complete len:283 (+) Transcript_60080:45-893(+)